MVFTTKYENKIRHLQYIIIKWVHYIYIYVRSNFWKGAVLTKENFFLLFAHSIAPFVEIREKGSAKNVFFCWWFELNLLFFGLGIFTTFIFHSNKMVWQKGMLLK